MRGLDRDRGLIGEERGEVQRLRGEGALLQAVVDVQHARRTPVDANRQPHHRAQLQVLDAGHAGETFVTSRVDGQDRLVAFDDLLRDAER